MEEFFEELYEDGTVLHVFFIFLNVFLSIF